MIFLYVIASLKKKFRYIGITDDLERRLTQHNSGYNKSTRSYAPFRLMLVEKYKDYKEARAREKVLKSGQGRKVLDSL